MNVRGFTLIELAVVLAIAGVVTSVSLLVLPRLWHNYQRTATQAYLSEAKDALLVYANNRNALPTATEPLTFPAVLLKSKAIDSYGQTLRYVVQPQLLDSATTCAAFRDYVAGVNLEQWPRLWVEGMAETAGTQGIAVAAILISRGADGDYGQKLIDSDGDPVTPDERLATNADGNPNYILAAEHGDFDDLVAYITIPELLQRLPLCQN